MRLSLAGAPTSLASAARQLEYALAQSATVAEAFQKLYSLADERQITVLRELEALLGSPSSAAPSDRRIRLSAFPTLAWLLRQTPDPARSAAALLEAYRRRAAYASATATIVWTEFTGFLIYLGAVLAILLLIVGVYALWELPNFRAMYASLDHTLPPLTAITFGSGALLLSLLYWLAAALLATLGWFVLCLRQQLRRFAPMAPALQRVPLIGSVVRSYHEYLWLSYAGLLRAAGMPSALALQLGAARIPSVQCPDWDKLPTGAGLGDGAGESGIFAELLVAARLGKLDEEVSFQQEAAGDALLEALARCRRRARVILTIAVYYLVATYVAAMYLPLFLLGSEI